MCSFCKNALNIPSVNYNCQCCIELLNNALCRDAKGPTAKNPPICAGLRATRVLLQSLMTASSGKNSIHDEKLLQIFQQFYL